MGEYRWERARRVCREYFAACDREDRRYTVAGLRMAFGADGAKWDGMMADEKVRPILDLALDKIRDSLEQRADQMAVAQLRQPEFGKKRAEKDEGGKAVLEVVFGDGGKLEEYGA